MYRFRKVLYYFAQSQSHQIAGFNVLRNSFESLLCSLFPVIAELLVTLAIVDILQPADEQINYCESPWHTWGYSF